MCSWIPVLTHFPGLGLWERKAWSLDHGAYCHLMLRALHLPPTLPHIAERQQALVGDLLPLSLLTGNHPNGSTLSTEPDLSPILLLFIH